MFVSVEVLSDGTAVCELLLEDSSTSTLTPFCPMGLFSVSEVLGVGFPGVGVYSSKDVCVKDIIQKVQFFIFCGELWQNSRPLCYCTFKN